MWSDEREKEDGGGLTAVVVVYRQKKLINRLTAPVFNWTSEHDYLLTSSVTFTELHPF